MKKFNIWTKGPYSAAWEPLGKEAVSDIDADYFLREAQVRQAERRFVKCPANVDPNKHPQKYG